MALDSNESHPDRSLNAEIRFVYEEVGARLFSPNSSPFHLLVTDVNIYCLIIFEFLNDIVGNRGIEEVSGRELRLSDVRSPIRDIWLELKAGQIRNNEFRFHLFDIKQFAAEPESGISDQKSVPKDRIVELLVEEWFRQFVVLELTAFVGDRELAEVLFATKGGRRVDQSGA